MRPKAWFCALGASLLFLVGCQGPGARKTPEGSPQETPVYIAMERRDGGRLVVIGASGDRLADAVQPPQAAALDQGVSLAPNGARLAFASTRGRADLAHTSIWIASYDLIAAAAPPRRITLDDVVDTDPVWSADSASVVFASNRAGTFDLWRIPIDAQGVAGAPVQLTSAPGDELMPSVRVTDGAIAYVSIARTAEGASQSVVEVLMPDGKIVPWTYGPGDTTPAFTAKGLYFSAPHIRMGAAAGAPPTVDADIAFVDRAGATPSWVLEVSGTDESGPSLSADERWLFATSVVRDPAQRPVWSSVVHIDRRESEPKARMSVDRAGAVIRSAPAVFAGTPDAAALHRNPDYVDELVRIHGQLKARVEGTRR